MTNYERFARDLWKKGTSLTDSGKSRVVTRAQFERAKTRHDMTEASATMPYYDERFQVSITEGGVVMVYDTRE